MPSSGATTVAPSTFSKSGAFNGTGMATMNPANGNDGTWLVYQDYTGDIRYTRYSLSGAWQSSQSLGIKDAANASSLAAVSYQAPGRVLVSFPIMTSRITMKITTFQYRVFYIDVSGTIKDIIMSNTTSNWDIGNIANNNFKAPPERGVALSVTLGSSNYGLNQTGPGLRLYAGGYDGLIHEYGFDQNTDIWKAGYAFPATNGYSGVGPEIAGNLTTLHLVSADNELELWWRDWNRGDDSFPSGSWNRGAKDSSPIQANSSVSVCFGDAVAYYQDPSLGIKGAPWDGYEASEVWNSSFSVTNAQGVARTTITCAYSPTTASGNYTTHVYIQGNGSNIVEYRKEKSGWSLQNYLPV